MRFNSRGGKGGSKIEKKNFLVRCPYSRLFCQKRMDFQETLHSEKLTANNVLFEKALWLYCTPSEMFCWTNKSPKFDWRSEEAILLKQIV